MEQQAIILDHHPADSRTDIADDQNTIQTLTSRMGTGGGNVPMILEYHSQAIPAGFGEGGANTTTPCLIVEPITYDGQQVTSPLHKDNTQGGVCHTLNSDSRNYVVIPIAVLGGGREHSTICMDETAPTLCTFQDSKPILIARIDNAEIL